MAAMMGPIVQTMNIVVFTTSWLIIHPAYFFLDDYKYDYDDWVEVYWMAKMIFSHSTPLICSTINMFMLSDVLAYMDDIWLVIVVGVLFDSWNYVYYRLTGKVVYGFLDWSDGENWWQYALLQVI